MGYLFRSFYKNPRVRFNTSNTIPRAIPPMASHHSAHDHLHASGNSSTEQSEQTNIVEETTPPK